MVVDSLTSLTDALRQYHLLEGAQLEELSRIPLAGFSDPRALARELVRRGWLTPHQVNQLFLGRSNDLGLGSYVLLEKLGSGGMGQVFKARNWKLGNIVALKLIRKERLANAEAVRRFHREIRLAAHLDHPNIVRALDADEVGGAHFLVMEYVHGVDLAHLMQKRGALPAAEACEYIRQAALGLQHAHERGMVHRDIKPHNLLLTNDGTTVKVLDMGLARATQLAEDVAAHSLQTQEGAVMGTPDYIAPEQALSSHGVDIRADLYSLGCTLYFLLSGRVPFHGGSLTQKLLWHQTRAPLPLEEVRPGIPPEVGAVVRQLMAKKPEQRFQTPAELAEALADPIAWASSTTLFSLNLSQGGYDASTHGPEGMPAPTIMLGELPANTILPAAAVAATALFSAAPGPSVASEPPLAAAIRSGAAPAEGAASFSLPSQTDLSGNALYSWRARAQQDARQFWLIAGGVGGLALLGLIVMIVVLARAGGGTATPKTHPVVHQEPSARPAGEPDNTPLPGPVDANWTKEIAALPAEKQVDMVSRKLRGLNHRFDGKLTPQVDKGVVTGLLLHTDAVTDLSPLRALTGLKDLTCTGSGDNRGALINLGPLKGLALTSLSCADNSGMSDLGPLKGMRLKHLDLRRTLVADLAPLHGMPLKFLDVGGTEVANLAPLKDMPLAELSCDGTKVADLAPLKALTLKRLHCDNSLVSDLAPLRASRLTVLSCAGSPVASLTPLEDLPLEDLQCDFRPWRGDADVLRAIPTLKTINREPALVFWKTVAAEHSAFNQWVSSVRRLPANKQAQAVAAELKKRNPGFDGKLKPTLESGAITGLEFLSDRVTDLSPVRALAELVRLDCHAASKGRLADLAPLKDMRLEALHCENTCVADLSPLRDMPLKELVCHHTNVADLTPLKELPLTSLNCSWSPVADLRPLTGVPLSTLSCEKARVTDLAPLKALPLRALRCDFQPQRDAAILRALTSLQTVNGLPAAELLK